MKTARTMLPLIFLAVAVLASAVRCSGEISQTPPDGGHLSADLSTTNPTCNVAGTVRCGASCVDLSVDPGHCGACNQVCGAGAQCCSGACNQTTSCSFAVLRIDQRGGYQNGGDYLQLEGAGFQPGMRVYIGDGRAPTRVIDAAHAVVQIPPGPVGVHDVRLVLPGGQAATYLRAFSYTSGQLGSPWQQKPMQNVRGEDPGVAVLRDGRVLVAGGTTVPDSTAQAVDTAELYSRDSDRVVPAKNAMSTPRWQDSAITLLDDRVLVVGGACKVDLTDCYGNPSLADLFDPTTDTFRPTAMPLNRPRVYTRAVLLVDGRVLIASGNDPTIEIYDPVTDTFSVIQHRVLHRWGFVVRLRDGRVLLGGGDGGVTAAEVFDPDTNTITDVGPLKQGRSMLSAHTVPDGRVLVIGGASLSAGGIDAPLDTIEYFNTFTDTFDYLPYKLAIGRTWHASALVRDGTILVMGGYTLPNRCDSLDDTVDQIDPVMGRVVPFSTLPNKNTEWNAVTLLDGSVLGVGGGACGTSTALPDLDFLPGGPG